jgi:hypothetical protein
LSAKTKAKLAAISKEKSFHEYTDDELNTIFDGFAEWDGRTEAELDAELYETVKQLDRDLVGTDQMTEKERDAHLAARGYKTADEVFSKYGA